MNPEAHATVEKNLSIAADLQRSFQIGTTDTIDPVQRPCEASFLNDVLVKRHPELPPLRHEELPHHRVMISAEGCFRR